MTVRKSKVTAAKDYLSYLKQELEMVIASLGFKPIVKQLHWGGGTPNFLSPDEFVQLKSLIDAYVTYDSSAEISVELDPRTTTQAHVDTLFDLGFNRISMGVQDFSKDVQKAINRHQSVEMVSRLFEWIRQYAVHSINIDLIYGLPFQTTTNFLETIRDVLTLRPDRIALYSYAHVPWLKSQQRLISEESLPNVEQKLEIFVAAREQFLQAGYAAIGMDHFALPQDELAIAFDQGKLNRNFMGYTVQPTEDMIGLGVSSIGFVSGDFIQNVRELKDYYARIDQYQLPVERGLSLSKDDHIRRWVIQAVMCRFGFSFQEFYEMTGVSFFDYFLGIQSHLEQCKANDLITVDEQCLAVTPLGRFFVRNIAMGFDRYLNKPLKQTFSKAV